MIPIHGVLIRLTVPAPVLRAIIPAVAAVLAAAARPAVGKKELRFFIYQRGGVDFQQNLFPDRSNAFARFGF